MQQCHRPRQMLRVGMFLSGKGFSETASALIEGLYWMSTVPGHSFTHTDGCCSELNWNFCKVSDKLVQLHWFQCMTWCICHSCNLCDAASPAMDRALQNVGYYYGLTDMAGLTTQRVVRNNQRFARKLLILNRKDLWDVSPLFLGGSTSSSSSSHEDQTRSLK